MKPWIIAKTQGIKRGGYMWEKFRGRGVDKKYSHLLDVKEEHIRIVPLF